MAAISSQGNVALKFAGYQKTECFGTDRHRKLTHTARSKGTACHIVQEIHVKRRLFVYMCGFHGGKDSCKVALWANHFQLHFAH